MTDHPDPSASIQPTVRLTATFAGASQAVYDVRRALTIFGSGVNSDVVLSSAQVDAAHAAVIRLGSSAFVCDLGGRGGTRVNGRFARWTRLQDLDRLEIGPFNYDVTTHDPPYVTLPNARPFTLSDDHSVGTVSSDDPVLLIGSDAACDVVVSGSGIEPRHGLVAWTFEGPTVRSLSCRSSLLLNGRPVQEARLVHGDILGVGSYQLRFEIARQSGEHPDSAAAARTAQPAELRPEPDRRIESSPPQESAERETRPEACPRDYDDLSEEEATREFVRALDHGAEYGETASAESKALDDSDVLELLENVEEIDESQAAAISEEQDDALNLHAGRLAEDSGVFAGPGDLRDRVVAAQNALDERARKLRAQLDVERSRLHSCQTQLQQQARRLYEAAKATRSGAAAVTERGQAASSFKNQYDHDEHSAAQSAPRSPKLDRLLSGVVRNEGSPGRAPDAASNASDAPTNHSLHDKVLHLSRLVRSGREEVNAASERLAGLKFEVERLREELARSKNHHETQQAEHDARLNTLNQGLAAVRMERESLVERLRRLETRENGLKLRIEDAGRVGVELARDKAKLTDLQSRYDERLRKLRVGLEEERHRLRIRQADLQKKAEELARLAAERRRSIEELVAGQQKAIQERESNLKARRSAIIEAGRAELERTATELEHLLSIRLSDVESELTTRQAHLDEWIEAICGGDGNSVARGEANAVGAVADAPKRAGRRPATSAPTASMGILRPHSALTGSIADLDAIGPERVNEPAGAGGEAPLLARIEAELEGLQRAASSLDDEHDRRYSSMSASTFGSSSFRRAPRSSDRVGGIFTANLSERISSLRSGLEHIGRRIGVDVAAASAISEERPAEPMEVSQ